MLPADIGDRRRQAGLEQHQRGSHRAGGPSRRRRGFTLGTAHRGFHSHHRSARDSDRTGGAWTSDKPVMVDQSVDRAAVPALTLPRLRWPWTLIGFSALAGALFAGVLIGPAPLGVSGVLEALLNKLPFLSIHTSLDPVQQSILWSVRVPRVVLGALVGGMLATAGAAYQGAFRNPLADPYLLGAASGAELGATLVIALAPGSSVLGINLVPVAAFAGAVLAVAGSYALSKTVRGMRSV